MERLLVARVGPERIAIPAMEVMEVIEASSLTLIPLAPEGLRGQCLWRDLLVPVLDPYLLTGVPRSQAAGANAGVVLVIRRGSGAFAIWVDDVEQVLDVDPTSIREVPPGLDRAARLSKLLRTTDGLVAVLDVGVLHAAADATLQEGARR